MKYDGKYASIDAKSRQAGFVRCCLRERPQGHCLAVKSFIIYQIVNTLPARGDRIIIIIEKVNDSMEVSVALCSEGSIS